MRDRGPFELALKDCEIDVLVNLGKGTDIIDYRMPADTTWESVTDFYGSRIGPDWRIVHTVRRSACWTRTWQRDGLFSDSRFVIALLDEPALGGRYDATPFRALVVGLKP